MANKEERIASIIRKNVSEIIQFQLRDPNIGFISITDVKVSKDISWATVYVSFFNEKDIKPSMQALERSKGYIRTQLSHMLDTRRCPEIRFVLDEGYLREARIDELLNKKK